LATRAEAVEGQNVGELKDRISELEGQLQSMSLEDANYVYLKGELAWTEMLVKLAA
jgi:hypothetical protein